MSVVARSRFGLGSVASFALGLVDAIGRGDVLRNFGLVARPGSAASHLFASLSTVPPLVFAISGGALGLGWVLYPTIEEYGPSWMEVAAAAWWSIRGRPTLRLQTYGLAGRLRRLAWVEQHFSSSILRMTKRWTRVSPTYWAVKSAIENHVGSYHPLLVDLRKTFPLGTTQYRHMASLLERIAPLIPSEAEAVPIPKKKLVASDDII